MNIHFVRGGTFAVDMQATTLDEFCKSLSRVVDRPVVDKTGIKGLFATYVEFTPDQSTPGLLPLPSSDVPRPPASDDPTAGPSIFTAVQEQLGLRLVSTKGPSEFIIIDHVEKPSDN
jgi:uncharacterized protein (TIGR03435 family)